MTVPGGLNATATAVLRFDASAVRPGVMDANSALQQLYGTVRDNWWGIRNLGEVMAGIGGIISGGLGGATAAAVGFEQATQTIFKNVSDSATILPERMAEIRKGLEDISTRSPVALDGLIKIAQQGALFGIASDQVVEFTQKVADLTVGTNLTAQNIGDLKKVMNEFKLPVDDIDRLGSALFVAEKNTSAQAGQILTLTKNYGSVFNAIGATADQAIALSAILVSQGGQAQSSATALQNLFLKVGAAATTNVPLFENYAKVAGLSTEAFKELINTDPVSALVKIAGGLADVSHHSTDLAAVTTDLGLVNKRQVLALEDLASSYAGVKGGAAGLETVLQRTAAAYRDTTAYQREVQRQSQTTAAQVQILRNDLRVLAIGIGAEVLPALNGIVHVLQNVVLGFAQLPDGVRQGVVLFGGLTGGTLLLVGALALIVPRLVQAAAAVKGLGESMAAYEAVQQTAIALTLEQEGAEAAAALTKVRWGQSRRAAVYAVIAAEEEYQASLVGTIALETAWLGVETTKTIALEAATAAEEASAAMIALRNEMNLAALAGDGERLAALAAQLPAYTAASTAAGAHALASEADAQAALGAAMALDAEAAAAAAAAAVEAAATPVAVAFGLALDFMTGPIGLIIIGITALVAAVGTLMYFMGRATKATDEYKDANSELSQQLAATGADVKAITNAFLLQQKGMLETTTLAEHLGISISDLFAVIRGDASAAVSAGVIDKLNKAIADGVPGAQDAANAIDKYNKIVVASQRAAQELGQANAQLGTSSADATASTLGLVSAQDKAKDAAKVRASAELSLVSAERALKDATAQVADAEQKLAEARQGLADRSFNIKSLEDALFSARLSEKDATEALSKAEDDLKNARSNAAAQLQMDKLNLAKAKAQEVLDTLNLKKAQDELNGAQNSSDADLASKTERLADARKLLFQATKEAADAEYNLMTLKQQGASAEDIAAAQRRVNDAKNNTKTAQVQVDDLGATSAKPDDPTLEAAQSAYNLIAAQQSLAATQQTIIDLTQKVSKEQKDAAHDKAYKDAVDAVTQAQINLRGAQDRTRTATRDLDREMSTNPEAKAYADAQRDVEDALFARAQAAVNVKKYEFELSGQTFTTQQEVDALRGALQDEADTVSGPLRTSLLNYAAQLKGLPDTVPGLKGPSTAEPTKNIGAIGTQIKGLETDHRGILDRIFTPSHLLAIVSPWLGGISLAIKNWGPDAERIFSDIWNTTTRSLSDAYSRAFKDLPVPLQNAFKSMGGALGGAFSAAFQASLGPMEYIVNKFIDVINDTVIKYYNFVASKTPGLDTWDKIDHVKFHAVGGVFNTPHLGMVAEAGPEAIMPIATLTDMMRPIVLLTAQLASQQRNMEMLALQRGSASGNASSHNDNSRVYNMVFNNAHPERASDDLPRALRKIEFVGD